MMFIYWFLINNFNCYIQSCNTFNFWYIVLPIILKIGLAQGFYKFGIKPCLVKQSFWFELKKNKNNCKYTYIWQDYNNSISLKNLLILKIA